jgi:hypothetical protein
LLAGKRSHAAAGLLYDTADTTEEHSQQQQQPQRRRRQSLQLDGQSGHGAGGMHASLSSIASHHSDLQQSDLLAMAGIQDPLGTLLDQQQLQSSGETSLDADASLDWAENEVIASFANSDAVPAGVSTPIGGGEVAALQSPSTPSAGWIGAAAAGCGSDNAPSAAIGQALQLLQQGSSRAVADASVVSQVVRLLQSLQQPTAGRLNPPAVGGGAETKRTADA